MTVINKIQKKLSVFSSDMRSYLVELWVERERVKEQVAAFWLFVYS